MDVKITIDRPDSQRIVLDRSVQVSGSVTADSDAAITGQIICGTVKQSFNGGLFDAIVPLTPGINLITVKAAVNEGPTAVEYLLFVRMVANRSRADVEEMESLLASGYTLEEEPPETFGIGQLLDLESRYILDASGRLILMGGSK